MPRLAARALDLLPYRSRRDVAARGAMAQVACGEDGPTDGTRGEKSAVTRTRQKPDVGRRSPSKGQGQGHVQMERDQSENSGRGSTPQLNQNPTKSAGTARATQNKNKELYRVGKVWPHHLPTRLGDVSVHRQQKTRCRNQGTGSGRTY